MNLLTISSKLLDVEHELSCPAWNNQFIQVWKIKSSSMIKCIVYGTLYCYCVQIDGDKVEKHIKEIMPEGSPIYDVVEIRKMNELLVNASLDELLTMSKKISAIIGELQDEFGASSDSDISTIPSSLEVIASDTSDTSIAEPKRKPKLPEEWVSLLQKSQPDRNPSHDVRGAWQYDARKDVKHLYAEYDHRINKNLAYLSES